MNVDELQLHLSNLAQLLENAGSKVAKPLSDFCQRLQPYRDRKLTDLLALLDQADEIVRTGTPPPRKTTPRKPKADPALAEGICNRIVELYTRAREPDTSREHIEHAFVDLDKLNLPVPKLQELAKRMDIGQKFRTKKDLLAAMQRAALERKGALQRVEV